MSVNTNYQVNGNLTWIKNRHSVKTGWQTVRRHLNFFESQDPARGFWNFNGEFTNNTRGAGGNAIASLLLGYPTQISRATLFGSFGLRGWEHAWYVQDDFKVSRRLTLNLGLRHELFLPLTEAAGRLANFNFDPANPAPNLIPALGGPKYAGRKKDNNNLAPRVGFAYSLTEKGKTVVRGSFGMHYVSVHYAGQGALGRNVPFMPIQVFAPGSLNVGRNLSQGIPVPRFQPLNSAAEVQAAAAAGQVGQIQAVDRDTKFSRSQQWGLDVQHEIGEGLLVDAGYVGSRGLNLFSSYNLNQAQPGPGAVAARRPWQPISNIANLNFLGYFAASSYHGLLTKVQKTFKNGTTVMAVYTWGKSIDDSISGSSGQTNRPGGYQNINDRRSARAESTFNVPHRFVLSGVYELPVGKSGGVAGAVLGGWQLNSIATFQSGFAFTPSMAASNLNNAGAYQLPNRVCNGALPDSGRSISRWFDTSCFVAPPAFTYGNSGLNILRGPGLSQVDLAVLKNFALGFKEGAELQFRAEAFNIANRANFRLPNFNIGVAAGGTITNTLTGFGRQVQMVLKLEF
ncbi:MAG: hypothetical protein FJW39_29610 [Acidobacteria bacterium]|nr:hypothetical protein [Acidobacteriota bacterium]